MKKEKTKTRAELHAEFVRECKVALEKKSHSYTHHKTVDQEIDKLRNPALTVNCLIKKGKRIGRVIKITGNLIDARDVQTREVFTALTYLIERL